MCRQRGTQNEYIHGDEQGNNHGDEPHDHSDEPHKHGDEPRKHGDEPLGEGHGGARDK